MRRTKCPECKTPTHTEPFALVQGLKKMCSTHSKPEFTAKYDVVLFQNNSAYVKNMKVNEDEQ